MGTDDILLGGNHAMDEQPVQGGGSNTPRCFMLRKPA